MKIQIFTLCDYAQNNAGKLTIVGTFNQIFTDRFPYTYTPSFFVVAKLSSQEPCQGKFSFTAYRPDGSPLLPPFTGDFRIDNPENEQKERAFDFCLSLNNQLFNEPGTYSFRFVAGDQVATQELYLIQRPKQQ